LRPVDSKHFGPKKTNIVPAAVGNFEETQIASLKDTFLKAAPLKKTSRKLASIESAPVKLGVATVDVWG
jgi:hypothetical protein